MRAPTIHLPELGICISLRELRVFTKRTSFVANYREFFLAGVELCVSGCALRAQLVASEREAGEALCNDGSRGRIALRNIARILLRVKAVRAVHLLPPGGLRDGAGTLGAVNVSRPLSSVFDAWTFRRSMAPKLRA